MMLTMIMITKHTNNQTAAEFPPLKFRTFRKQLTNLLRNNHQIWRKRPILNDRNIHRLGRVKDIARSVFDLVTSFVSIVCIVRKLHPVIVAVTSSNRILFW